MSGINKRMVWLAVASLLASLIALLLCGCMLLA
jgi:hypothetical protein